MAEVFTLDGLALNDGTAFRLLNEVDMTPPKQRPEWIGAADSEYQDLVRNPLHENRTIVLPLEVVPTATKDLALDKVGLVQDKLAKASKTQGGIPLVWTPHGSARTVTFDVLAGEITDLPLDFMFVENKMPRPTVTLTCKPYGRLAETLTATASSSTPFVTLELANNIGDVPALGRLIVTDLATQSRRHVEWGLEGPLTYNSATSLLVASDNMVTSGFGGTAGTQAGAYDPNATGNNVISMLAQPVVAAIAGTGNLSHVGVFRVRGRVWSDAVAVDELMLRFAWQAADGPMNINAWSPWRGDADGEWQEHDFGTITIPTVLSGTQRWTGQVEVINTGGATAKVNYLQLVPVTDGYGKARGVYMPGAGTVSALDYLNPVGVGGSALNARVATLGGSWATSGDATDFVLSADGTAITRAALSGTNGRYAILGTTNFTNMQVSVTTGYTGTSIAALTAIARWTDANNHVRLTFDQGVGVLYLIRRVAGVSTVMGQQQYGGGPGTMDLRLTVYASGRAIGELIEGGATRYILDATHSALATGGTLASGEGGIHDLNTTAIAETRTYDNFSVAIPPAEPVAIYSGRNMQFRHDDTIRQDSTGVYTGRPQSYRGSRFLVPVGTSRVLVKARRNDVDVSADDTVTDSTQIQVGVTPRVLAVPRA